jgi:hypothetical protein
MANNKDNLILGSSLGTQLGAPGTWISGGFITHEEYNQKLLWRRGIDIFDKMRKSDASIQALLKVCKHPLLAATWSVEAASDEEFDQYVQRFVENELFNKNVNWYNFLRDALGKLDFGFAVFEKTYEMTTFEKQDRIGLNELGWRKQWSILRWETEDHNPGVSQQLIGETVSIPEEKLLVFVNDREGDNYQGVSVLRYCYKDWDIKHRIENIMAVAAERSLGVPVFEQSPKMSKNDEQKMENVLKNFRANQQGYIKYIMGTGKLDWMKIETNIEKDLIPILEYLQHEIDKSVLAQFLDLAGSRSGGTSGSHALSADQSQLFEKALEAVAKEVVGVLNEDLVQQLCDLNFSDMPNGYPKVSFSNIGDQNLAEKGTFMNLLAAVDLLTPDPDLENVVRDWADLPDLPDDIYENYDERSSAQTAAVPLTQLGPGQNPNPTDPSMVPPLIDPKTGMPAKVQPQTTRNPKHLKERQTNIVTRSNQKKDMANKPANTPNSYPNPRTKAAIEEAQKARQNLIAAILEK